MTTFTQEERRIAVDTPLGDDVLLLGGCKLVERVSGHFDGALDMLSTERAIQASDIVGKAVGVRISVERDQPRWFHGIVSRFAALGLAGHDLRRYRAEVVAWPWLLTHNVNCRIFQKKTALEIVEGIFSDHGLTDYETRHVKRTPAKREYCVQFRESDHDFVCRLLEDEGIFFYVRHEQGRHVLVLADSARGWGECREAEAPYSDGSLRQPHIVDWQESHGFQAGAYAHSDYNFETPAVDLTKRCAAGDAFKMTGADGYEVYDYPGLYPDGGLGEQLARLRIEAIESAVERVHGLSTCVSFAAGHTFKLSGFECDPAQNGREFVLLEVVHAAEETSYLGGADAGRYSNSFQAVTTDVAFRPPRSTPRPRADGVHSAVVVGPSGEEIYTDEHGRVKVQFPWDREGRRDENSSCWMRVSQGWAGKRWGSVHLPRIGQEVLVEFIDGDPDRPIVTGRVYNADQQPPYELPAEKTKSGVKTRSSLGGSDSQFNELRFEDKKGEEEVYLHAEKDMNRVVENDDTLNVGGNQTIEVTKDRTETVTEGNETVTIEQGDRSVTIGNGKESLLVKTGDREVVVETGSDVHQVKSGDRKVVVETGNDSHEISMGDRSVTLGMGNDTIALDMGSRDVKISMGDHNLQLDMGNQCTKLAMGASSTEALQSIELKVGGSSIKVDPTGVTIKGMMVKLEGSMLFEAKGLLAKMEASGMLKLQGSITMIN